MLTFLEKSKSTKEASSKVPTSTVAGSVGGQTPSAWAHSSVTTFGVRYSPPVPDLSPSHGVEALVEGSEMSMLREGAFLTYHLTCLILSRLRESHDT
jgi:hypothetical protein